MNISSVFTFFITNKQRIAESEGQGKFSSCLYHIFFLSCTLSININLFGEEGFATSPLLALLAAVQDKLTSSSYTQLLRQ